MAYTNGPPTIVTDGLVLYTDTMNPRSYVSGSTSIYDLANFVGGVTAPITGSVPGTIGLKATPLTTQRSGTGNLGLSFPLTASVPQLYFDSRADRFTFSVWASVQNIDVDSGNNTAQGVFARGSFGGFVGIDAQRQTTASATQVRVGSRDDSGTTRTVQLTSNLQTGSVPGSGTSPEAEIFNAVMVYDSSSLYGYYNGVYMGSASLAAMTAVPFSGTRYGCNSPGGIGGNGEGATMSIYNTSVYNRALSAQEVTQNFNAMRGRFGV